MASIVLGVGGGIAAYKVAGLLRLFTEAGHSVRVIPTRSALAFVGEATWSALSGQPASAEVWDDVHEVPHVRIGQAADLVVVAPATADLMARAAAGMADDLLTNTLLTARCPVVFAPAMHTEMWEHPATRANVATLRDRGITVIEPASGRLTGADTGPGRLPEPQDIFEQCTAILGSGRPGPARGDLSGRRIVVSAGGTREPLDPVRFLGNASSGIQGYAIAEAALARGAEVCIVAANVTLAKPEAADLVEVGTAAELHAAVLEQAKAADAVIMAAAVADFRPVSVAGEKIKKDDDPTSVPTITLERTTDVLADLVARRAAGELGTEQSSAGPLLVGFAAETGDSDADWLEHGRRKLARKGCDIIVVNDVGEGRVFGSATNSVVILSADPASESAPISGTKADVAAAIVDVIAGRL